MTLNLRFANAADRDAVTDFVIMAGAGLFEQVFENSYPGLRARDVIKFAVSDKNNQFFSGNALLAEEGGKVSGCLLFYSTERFNFPSLIRTMIPSKRLDPLRGIIDADLPFGMYINTLAVREAARGRGIARLLIESVSELAFADGISSLFLHVWAENFPAVKLYEKMGFRIIDEIAVPPTEYLKYKGPMLLLQLELGSMRTPNRELRIGTPL